MDLTERTVESQLVYQGKVITVREDIALLPNGRTAKREWVAHPGAVAILPLDEQNNVHLVTQYRYPLGKTLLEIPAGKLEPGEDHRLCALRELEEEIGAVPQTLTYLGYLALSPGFSNEILHVYLAQNLQQVASHPDEDEFLAPSVVPLDTVVSQVMSGEITDGKTVAAVLKVKLLLGL